MIDARSMVRRHATDLAMIALLLTVAAVALASSGYLEGACFPS